MSFFTKNIKGQSTVEYVLLLAVVLTFMTTIWNSKAFKDFFSKDSKFFAAISEKVRVSYRFAAVVPIDTGIGDNPIPRHPSFTIGVDTRFFTQDASDSYPASP